MSGSATSHMTLDKTLSLFKPGFGAVNHIQLWHLLHNVVLKITLDMIYTALKNSACHSVTLN